MNIKLIKESDLYKWQNNEKLSKLINIFSNRVDIRFVGGCIRDVLLGFELKDIDFTVNCEPNDTIKILSDNKIDFEDYGISHGTVTAIIGKTKYEITSLRKDIKTDGRFAKVQYTKNWEEDALRRDFSMNAIYLSINGEIYDLFDGVRDIKENKISFIGNTLIRIQEDYLRIIRFYRFLGIFRKPNYVHNDFAIINNEFQKIKKFISKNKIKSEIIKMQKNPFPKNSFSLTSNDDRKNNKNLIEKLEDWWAEDKYKEGLIILSKCKNIMMKEN